MSRPDHHEIERSYAVPSGAPLPDLTGVPGVVAVGEPDEAVLVAAYVDTDDLALIRAGVTLRRRTGGADEGWHLKVPAGQGRDEVHRPVGRSATRVPAPLERAVLGWTRGRALGVVATVETHRTTRLLHGEDGSVLAEVCDDQVRGTPVGQAGDEAVPAWREVEVELVEAAPSFLDDVDAAMAAAGVEPSGEQRKIGTVLGARLAELAELSAPLRPAALDEPAGRVLHHRVRALVDELGVRDADVRRGVDDGVHQLRVTCRRLRAALATYRPLVDRTVTDPLREELRWLARTLGAGRDAEVMHAHLRTMLDDEPAVLVVGPVRRRVDAAYRDRLRAAEGHAEQVLTSRRYLRLRARLDRLAASPPFTEEAGRPAGKVLTKRVRRDLRRVRRRVEVAQALAAPGADAVDTDAHDEALHEVRKAAKRLRYACETLEPVFGSDAKKLRKAAQRVTSVLGDRQDSTVARTDLRTLARAADRAGESSFTYGLLHAREAARSLALEGDFALAWERLRDPALTSWLD